METMIERIKGLSVLVAQDVKRLDSQIANIPHSAQSSDFYNWVRQYIGTRGNTLISNYSGLWGSNVNFSEFTLDRGDKPDYCYSSWSYNQTNIPKSVDEYIPVNYGLDYYYSFYAKQEPNSTATFHSELTCFDLDKKQISEFMITRIKVRVLRDIQTSSRTLILDNESYTRFKEFHNRTKNEALYYYVNFSNYKSDNGYDYKGEYSRNRHGSIYVPSVSFEDGLSSVNGFTMTAGTPILAGTELSIAVYPKDTNRVSRFPIDGIVPSNKLSNDWNIKYKKLIKPKTDFPVGTAYIRPTWITLNATGTTSLTTKISNIILKEIIPD